MSDAYLWQCASVAEFFSRCSWDGPAASVSVQKPAVAPAFVPSRLQLDDRDLLCLSVSQFFGALNWKDVPALGLPGKPAIGLSGSPLTLSVSHFVQCIDWEGRPEVGVAPRVTSSPKANTDMNSTHFSDLF